MRETKKLIDTLNNQLDYSGGGKIIKSVGKKIGNTKLAPSISKPKPKGPGIGMTAAKAFGKDTKRAIKQLNVKDSKALKVMSELLGAPWEKQKWYVKLIIVFTLICIFPAIPLFFVFCIMLKTLNYLFFYTRKL